MSAGVEHGHHPTSTCRLTVPDTAAICPEGPDAVDSLPLHSRPRLGSKASLMTETSPRGALRRWRLVVAALRPAPALRKQRESNPRACYSQPFSRRCPRACRTTSMVPPRPGHQVDTAAVEPPRVRAAVTVRWSLPPRRVSGLQPDPGPCDAGMVGRPGCLRARCTDTTVDAHRRARAWATVPRQSVRHRRFPASQTPLRGARCVRDEGVEPSRP